MSFHINAQPGDIAPIVLIPGDPIRAKYVAENYLEDAHCYNEVRGMYGYTGTFNGVRLSVQGSGMGMPSLAVYAHELITEYDVKYLIRIGTCGAIQSNLDLRTIILATSASGDSGILYREFNGLDFSAAPNFDLLLKAYNSAADLKISTLQGGIFSTDSFYSADEDRWKIWAQHGVLATEMESQMLYTLAARNNVAALSILTVSDNIITGTSLTSEEKEQSLDRMIRLALETTRRI